METSGGIDDDQIMLIKRRLFQSRLDDVARIDFGPHRKDFDVQLVTDGDHLVDRGRTVDVRSNQQRIFRMVFSEVVSQFPRRRRFTGALEADHHDHGRTGFVEIDKDRFRSHQFDKFIIDDLDDLLSGIQTLHDFFTHGEVFDFAGEFFHDFKIDIRLK